MVRIQVMKGLASDRKIAYNSGVQIRYSLGPTFAKSWNALSVRWT
jgi:hypothetical protein